MNCINCPHKFKKNVYKRDEEITCNTVHELVEVKQIYIKTEHLLQS